MIAVAGSILADVTPATLIGDITTGSCHGFASMLLIASTLTFGPMILKSMRVWAIFVNPVPYAPSFHR